MRRPKRKHLGSLKNGRKLQGFVRETTFDSCGANEKWVEKRSAKRIAGEERGISGRVERKRKRKRKHFADVRLFGLPAPCYSCLADTFSSRRILL
jgi:hypothetical protein